MKGSLERNFQILRMLRQGRGMSAMAWWTAISLATIPVAQGLSGVSEAMAQTPASGEGRRLTVRVVPKDPRKDGTAALIFRGILRKAADGMGGAGIRRAPGVEGLGNREIETVRSRVEAGYAALSGQRWEEAMEAYQAAAAALQPVLALADRVLVARVYKGLGITLLQAQKQLQAKDALKRSLTVLPGQTVSDYAFNVETRNFFRQVQQELEEAPEMTLEIEAENGAEVYVNGEFKGFSPIKILGLKPGDHWVGVFADGFRPWSQFVTVRGISGQKLQVSLQPAAERARQEEALRGIVRSLDKTLPEAEARTLAESTGATDLLVLRVSEDRNGFSSRGIFYSAGRTQPVALDIPRDRNVMTALQDLLVDLSGVPIRSEGAALALDPPPAALPEGEVGGPGAPTVQGGEDLIVDPNSPIFKDTAQRPRKSNLVRQWWFWTALIVGAGAVAGLTYWGVTAGSSEGGGGPTGDLRLNLNGIR